MPEDNDDRIKPTKEQLKARRNRSIAIAVALALFVLLVYLGSLMKFGPALFDRSM